MISLRSMTSEDLAIFENWLHKPHVAAWYHDTSDWLDEAENKNGEFDWIHHFIAEDDGLPVGFCQYYACDYNREPMEGYTALGGAYSIDYLIGETEHLRKGCGKQIVAELIDLVRLHSDARRIVVMPEKENMASRGLLLSCGFTLDDMKDVFVKELR